MNVYWLIDKVLSGKATGEEKQELDDWISQQPSHKEEYEDMKLLWEYSQAQTNDPKSDPHFYDGLKRIKEMIDSRKVKPLNNRTDWKMYTSIIALIISLVALVYCCISYSRTDKPDRLTRFNESPLTEVVKTIERDFKIRLEVSNQSILNCVFTGTINPSSKPEEVVKTITGALNLQYQFNGRDRFTIIGNGCDASIP